MTSTPPSTARRLAIWLTARAQRTLPASKHEWSEAMLGELHEIKDDWEALPWALGCLVASHLERARSQSPLEWLPVRTVIMTLLAWYVFNDLFAPVLTLAYRTNSLELARQLGRLTPGGDYRPLIPLLDAAPFWLYGLSLAGAAAHAVSAVRYGRRVVSPLGPFALGFVLEIFKAGLLQPFENRTGVNGDAGNALIFCIMTFLLTVAMLKRDSLISSTPMAE